MGSLSVQTSIGDVGKKATTELSFNFSSLLSFGNLQYGANSEGIFLLNTGESDSEEIYERSVVFATTDFGIKNKKRIRFIYIGIDIDSPFVVSVKVPGGEWRDYDVLPTKEEGIHVLTVPVGRDGWGRYWAIKVSATVRFRIDHVGALLNIRSLGIRG